MYRVRRMIFILLLTLLLMMHYAQPTGAASVTGALIFDPGCTALTVSGGGSVTWDRDTTGQDSETIILVVTDGLGTVLFQASDTRAIGISTTFFGSYDYTTAPALNPITAVLYSPAGEDLPAQTLVTGTGVCATLPSPSPIPSETPLPSITPSATAPGATSEPVYGGPAIPGKFALRTIVCDTPVYDAPAGSPVGDNAVHSGQTWYVNTTSVIGGDGQLWTEIFVAGKYNGYIPSRCVEFQLFGNP